MYFWIGSEQTKNEALSCVKSLPIGKGYAVKVKENDSITTAQRNYWHKLVRIISNHTGDKFKTEKMRIKFYVLPLDHVLINGEKMLFPPSSEDITRKQYAELIDETLIRGMELGLNMPIAGYEQLFGGTSSRSTQRRSASPRAATGQGEADSPVYLGEGR